MFTIDWNVPASNMVYDEFDEANLYAYNYNPNLQTIVSIDPGWTHEMACLFFQWDKKTDTVYLFDEIVESKLKKEIKRLKVRVYYRLNLPLETERFVFLIAAI